MWAHMPVAVVFMAAAAIAAVPGYKPITTETCPAGGPMNVSHFSDLFAMLTA